MPFNPPFRQEVMQRDLIYGLTTKRRLYVKKHPAFFGVNLELNRVGVLPSTIDQYIVPREVPLSKTGRVRYANMARDQENSPYHYSFISHLMHHEKYHTALTSSISNPAPATNRKCKGGLSWVTMSGKIITENMHIHFILDSISLEHVVKKIDYPGSTSNMTARELRWIFRNRFHPQVMNKIQFWHHGQPTTPPWSGHQSQLWQQYEPRFEQDWSAELSQLFHMP